MALLRTRLVGARMSFFFCGRRLEYSAFAHNLVVEAGLIKSVERLSPTLSPTVLRKSNGPVVTLSERFPWRAKKVIESIVPIRSSF